ncbi:MAG: FAD-dependent oxidoreductase [Salinarimonadaceae bacterium]|nr:MAG: FAD-dependent oxidoreductase [Salinarimonadaceae bacterium]
MSTDNVTVVGAGVAGLTAALALARAGRSVTLVERRTGFSEVGAGLQLSPNATRLLAGLGLGPALARQACEPPAVIVRDMRSGRTIGGVALGAFMRERFGAPYYVIHRADLQTILLDSVRAQPNIRLLMGRELAGLAQDSLAQDSLTEDSEGADLVFARAGSADETRRASLVVGADGIWSKMRPLLGDKRTPAYRGYVAWRATVPRAEAPPALAGDETGLWLGPDAHVVHYPVSGGRRVNVVAIMRRRAPVAGWSELARGADLLAGLASCAPDLRDLLAVPPEWTLWSLHDLPVGRIASGRVALIGDAAHPVLPFMAQGAAMAIEDAIVLTRAIVEEAAPAAALARYVRERVARVRRVQDVARANGRAYHAGALLGLARNFVMGRLGPTGMTERYAWIYGWTR